MKWAARNVGEVVLLVDQLTHRDPEHGSCPAGRGAAIQITHAGSMEMITSSKPGRLIASGTAANGSCEPATSTSCPAAIDSAGGAAAKPDSASAPP
jgi:hypothetical protein